MWTCRRFRRRNAWPWSILWRCCYRSRRRRRGQRVRYTQGSLPAGEKPIVTLDDIKQAQERIRGVAVRTPLIPFPQWTAGQHLYLKAESFQPIGSFKLRGAYNKISSLTAAEKKRGVI